MGAFWSLAARQQEGGVPEKCLRYSESKKRQRLSPVSIVNLSELIPGIPDEISIRILARVPRGCHGTIKLVCKAWNESLSGEEIFRIRREISTTEEWLYLLVKDEEDRLTWHALDPLFGKWRVLPPMPDSTLSEQDNPSLLLRGGGGGGGWFGSSGLKLTGLFRSFFGREGPGDRTPFCGCAAGALNSSLYVLGGFSKSSAMSCVWRYDPRPNKWTEVASMGTARAYCKTALLHGRLYVVGGVSRGRGGLTPLQSAEVYNPSTDTWAPIPNMPFAKTQMLPTAFLAEMLKPIATGLASFKGKLYVPQSLYSWPFFLDVGGELYDPIGDSWMEMPPGMGDGWPARQAGTKLSAVVDGRLYALDPTSSLDGSKIKVYDSDSDTWKVVMRRVPILLDLNDTESPYLLASFHRKLHVITKDINDNVTVLRAGGDPEAAVEGWKSIANRNFGLVELVTCQVLDI